MCREDNFSILRKLFGCTTVSNKKMLPATISPIPLSDECGNKILSRVNSKYCLKNDGSAIGKQEHLLMRGLASFEYHIAFHVGYGGSIYRVNTDMNDIQFVNNSKACTTHYEVVFNIRVLAQSERVKYLIHSGNQDTVDNSHAARYQLISTTMKVLHQNGRKTESAKVLPAPATFVEQPPWLGFCVHSFFAKALEQTVTRRGGLALITIRDVIIFYKPKSPAFKLEFGDDIRVIMDPLPLEFVDSDGRSKETVKISENVFYKAFFHVVVVPEAKDCNLAYPDKDGKHVDGARYLLTKISYVIDTKAKHNGLVCDRAEKRVIDPMGYMKEHPPYWLSKVHEYYTRITENKHTSLYLGLN